MLKQNKQINIKSIKENKVLLQIYQEAQKYLENIGFEKFLLISLTDADETMRSFLFQSGEEKIIIEYKRDMYEEIVKIIFSTKITFVYDILLMRINQLSNEEKESIYIFSD
ncbi:MAG: hypothetical protein QXM96_02875 [Candidatus Woesearchaeota archaeon]